MTSGSTTAGAPTPSPPLPPMPSDLISTPIVFYRDKFDREPAAAPNTTWGLLCEMLLDYVEESPCTLDGPGKCVGSKCKYKAFSSLPDNFMAWSPTVIVGLRDDRNVRAVTTLVLDFDHLTEEEDRATRAKLVPWEHLRHSTHSHRANNICWRACLPLSRHVLAGEFHRFYSAAVKYLDVPSDPVCKNRSRMYFRPSHPTGAPFFAERVRGKVLDVDEVLAWSVNVPITPPPAYDHVERVIVEGSEWDLDSEAVVDAINLAAAYFPPRRRNEFCLALAGMLRVHGATEDDARYIVHEVAAQGGSDSPDARAKTVDHTYALDADAVMTGLTRMAEILSQYVGDEAESLKIAKQIGDLFTDAANEAFLRNIDVVVDGRRGSASSAPESVAPNGQTRTSPAQVAVGLDKIRDVLGRLAARRARATDRNSQISGVLLRRALDGKPLACPGGLGDVETVRCGAQSGVDPDAALQIVAGALAFTLPLGTPWGPVGEVLRLSLAQMPPGEDWFVRAERVFKRAQMTRERGEIERRQRSEEVRQRLLAAHGVAGAPSAAPPPLGQNWIGTLKKKQDGSCAATYQNIQIILENDDNLRGTIFWDEHAKKIVVRGGWLEKAYAETGGDARLLAAAAQNYLSTFHEINVSRWDVADRLLLVAYANKFDSLREHLESLQWDGVSRIDAFLPTYFGVPPSEHVFRISRRWLIGAVARAFEPGCKFDNVLVFEGLQNRGKTLAFNILGERFYCSTAVDIHNKESMMLAASAWIVELAEMVSLQRSEVNAAKAFLTTREDRYRPPYGANLVTSPRRCVFVGTTNEDQYLSDPTGNRRYWPVHCGALDLEALVRDRDQLWAEAVAVYSEHRWCPECAATPPTVPGQAPRCAVHCWWLSAEEEDAAAEEVSGREEDQPWMAWYERIAAWWRGLAPNARPQSLTTSYVAMEVGELPVDRVTRRVQTEIGIALRRLGFKRRASKRVYLPTDELINQPRGGLFVIPGGKSTFTSGEARP